MAVTNSVCLTQTSCKKIIIQDSSNWDNIIPLVDIDSTTVEVDYGDIVYSHTYTGYQENIEVTATDLRFGISANLKDGKYNIIIVYVVDSTHYTIEEEAFIICNIQCIVDTLIADIATNPCDECNKDKKILALDATLKLDALEAAIACGNLVKAKIILDWLNDLLINYNCKNC